MQLYKPVQSLFTKQILRFPQLGKNIHASYCVLYHGHYIAICLLLWEKVCCRSIGKSLHTEKLSTYTSHLLKHRTHFKCFATAIAPEKTNTLHDSFVRKLHTLALAWDISRFSWLTSYLLVIELTVELDEDELKLPCFTCFGCFSWCLSRLSSSEVQNWTCRS